VPYDIIIRGVGILSLEVPETKVQLEGEISKMKWSKAEINSIGQSIWDIIKQIKMDITTLHAFLDNPDRTGIGLILPV